MGTHGPLVFVPGAGPVIQAAPGPELARTGCQKPKVQSGGLGFRGFRVWGLGFRVPYEIYNIWAPKPYMTPILRNPKIRAVSGEGCSRD